MNKDFFTDEVSNSLQAYVYRLIDPRNDETFYVGKGRGNRIFQHAKALNIEQMIECDLLSPKLERIRAIINSGHSVDYVIHRHGLTDDTAFEVEAALIDAFPNLHNELRGHYASERGLATTAQVQHRYNLPTCTVREGDRVLIIKINKLNGSRDTAEIYRLTHYCWKLRKKRAEKADYILALDSGVVVGAFVAHEWLPATKENFGYLDYADGSEAHRWGFKGTEANDETKQWYVGEFGKRLISNDDLKYSSQNPVRYVNC